MREKMYQEILQINHETKTLVCTDNQFSFKYCYMLL
jgi:hypothetical protein